MLEIMTYSELSEEKRRKIRIIELMAKNSSYLADVKTRTNPHLARFMYIVSSHQFSELSRTLTEYGMFYFSENAVKSARECGKKACELENALNSKKAENYKTAVNAEY